MILILFLSLFIVQNVFATPYQESEPWWNQTSDPVLQKIVQQAIVEAPDSKIAFEIERHC